MVAEVITSPEFLRGVAFAVLGVGFWAVGFVIYYVYLRARDDE